MKKILYVDMDNVLVDFPSGIAKLSKEKIHEYEGRFDEGVRSACAQDAGTIFQGKWQLEAEAPLVRQVSHTH
jgi:hypothetical protein